MTTEYRGWLHGGARIGWRRTISTTRMMAPQQRQTKVGTDETVISSLTGSGSGTFNRARALARFSRRLALASSP